MISNLKAFKPFFRWNGTVANKDRTRELAEEILDAVEDNPNESVYNLDRLFNVTTHSDYFSAKGFQYYFA